jgi:hypothetical protein
MKTLIKYLIILSLFVFPLSADTAWWGWDSGGGGTGTGDVTGPASPTTNGIPKWSGTAKGLVDSGVIFGTMTNGYYCTYTTTGTLLACNTQYPIASGLVFTGDAEDDIAVRGASVYGRLNITAQTLVGRITGGHLAPLSPAQVKTLLGYPTSGDYAPASGIALTALANQAANTVNANATAGAAAPTALAINQQEIAGRITGGNFKGLTLTDLYTYFGCNAANQVLGVNAANNALECKSTLALSSVALTGNLTGLSPSVIVLTASGVHSTGANAATLVHTTDGSTTGDLIGMTLYNITDGSSCTVTASTNTTITCTLVGGSENDWDVNDVYQLGPGPAQAGSVFYVTNASTMLHPTTAGYSACYRSRAAAALTIDFGAAMSFEGVIDTAYHAAVGNGKYIVSSGSTTGDYMCIHNLSSTVAIGMGKLGTWSHE